MSRQLQIYAVSTLLALMLLAVILGFVHRNTAIKHLLGLGEHTNIVLTRSLANGLWPSLDDFLHASGQLSVEDLRQSPELTRIDTAVREHIKGLAVTKVKIYNRQGMTIYSTQGSQIGESQARNHGVLQALDNTVHTELVYRDLPTSDGILEKRSLISTYLPMIHGEDKHVEGVFESYYDVTPLLQRLEQTQRDLAIAVLGILSLLYAGLILVVRFANGKIRESEEARQEYIRQIQVQNEALEQRVEERTQDLLKTNLALKTEVEVRRRAQEELHQAGVVFNNTSEAIVITDVHGAIQSVNPAFSAVTGYPPHEAMGQNMRMLKSGRHDQKFYQSMWQSMLREGRWSGEIWNRRKNGEVFPQLTNISAIRDLQGAITHYVAVFSDITPLKESEERLSFLAQHDGLTNLPNRLLLEDRMRQAVAHANRLEQLMGVLYFDLDRFAIINDSFGMDMGDQVLQEISRRLLDILREEDTIARMGGDEFVVLAQGVMQINDAVIVAEKILEVVARPIEVQGCRFALSASIGITLYPFDTSEAPELLKNANAAMVRAKKLGGNRFEFFTQKMGEIFNKRLAIEKELRQALAREEFHLAYQPQIDVASGRLIGVEALLRWRNPELGLVSPDQFIPLAEETGIIIPLGEWVLRTACQQSMLWMESGYQPIRMAVNLSARQFQQKNLAQVIGQVMQDTGIPPHMLELELTEGMVMDDVQGAVDTLLELRTMGLHIAIDDFGTGYSSLSYLKRFPIHCLKIDRSFIRDILIDPDDAVITRTIIAMAKTLGMSVVAEGVASEDQLEFLRTLECDTVQGYLFSPPVHADDITLLLDEDRHVRKPAPNVAALIPTHLRHQDNIISLTKRLEQGKDVETCIKEPDRKHVL